MKIKQILSLSFLAIVSAFMFNSCGGDEVNPAPGIDFIAENSSITGDVTMDGNKPFTIVFNVNDNSKVKTVVVTSVVNGRVSPQLDTTVNSASAKIKLSRVSYAAKATEVWTITATDDKGVSSSKSISITTTTEASGDPLTSYEKDNSTPPQTFKVYNFQGQKAGAFNLKDIIPMTINDPAADKDIQDSCITTETNNWPGRWTSKNGTQFRKVTGYAYADITNTGQLDAAWNASGNSMKFMVVAKDDLYIANIRGGTIKVLIQITNVVKTTGIGENNDYVEFKFKKKP